MAAKAQAKRPSKRPAKKPAARRRPSKREAPPLPQDPVAIIDWYCDGVRSGRIQACRELRWIIERHDADIATMQAGGPYVFDGDEVRKVVAFCGLCIHQKGPLAGQPFKPEPWQIFILGSVFGWRVRSTWTRRFRRVYQEIPRKNGKTFLLAAAGLYGLIADGEMGAEIYSAATKREQAREIFDVAAAMVKASPSLKRRITPLRAALSVKGSMSKFEPLGRDADTMDGKNPHMGLIDEYHAHRDDAVVEVLESGTGARLQPLIWIITTAGFNLAGPCKRQRDVCRDVLDPSVPIVSDTMFIFIATIDEGDDPHDEASWRKANPNYGVSVNADQMRLASDDAQLMPSQMNTFLTKRLNVWVGQSERWLDMAKWEACSADPMPFAGRRVCVGADLASTTDLCALVAISAGEDDVIDIRCRFWAPRERARLRQRKDRVPYLDWAEQGLLTLHDGEAIDYDLLREEILDTAEEWGFGEIGLDPWNATQLANQLMNEGLDMVQIRQGYQSLNEPTKELERRVITGRLRHGGHPILAWCASNVATEQDPAGNLKPSKRRSHERIDGIAALVNALARLMVTDEARPSIYETQGIRTL